MFLCVLKLAAGDIVGTKTNARLRGIHCYEIGNYAKIEGKYTMAIDWFNSALKFTKTDHTVDVGLIVSALSETYEMVSISMFIPRAFHMLFDL